MLGKNRAFSIIELLVVCLVGSVIVGVLFYALSSGQNVNDISSTKVLAQSESRRVVDWITRDLRQTVVWELANNNPSPVHVKFRPVLGWDIATNTYQLGSTYIEYNYNSVTRQITRNIVNSAEVILQSWVFNDIMTQPFFTRNNLGNIIPLDNSVGTSKKVITLISVTKVSNKGVSQNASLTAETKIRNE